MLNQPYNQNLRPSNNILSRRPTHTTVEIIWTKLLFMVFKSSKLKLNPKTRITWSWGPSCEHLTLDTCTYLQHITLHHRTKKASINMLKAIPTHNIINFYHTLKKYRIHSLWNTWQPMDVLDINNVGLTCENGHTWRREIDIVGPMGLIIYPQKTISIILCKTSI